MRRVYRIGDILYNIFIVIAVYSKVVIMVTFVYFSASLEDNKVTYEAHHFLNILGIKYLGNRLPSTTLISPIQTKWDECF